VVKELCCAINGDFLQTRREGDDTNVFSGGRGSEFSGVATEHDLYKNIGDVDVCTEFEMLKSMYLSFFSAQWVSVEMWNVVAGLYCNT
jgi:hypothetical protein